MKRAADLPVEGPRPRTPPAPITPRTRAAVRAALRTDATERTIFAEQSAERQQRAKDRRERIDGAEVAFYRMTQANAVTVPARAMVCGTTHCRLAFEGPHDPGNDAYARAVRALMASPHTRVVDIRIHLAPLAPLGSPAATLPDPNTPDGRASEASVAVGPSGAGAALVCMDLCDAFFIAGAEDAPYEALLADLAAEHGVRPAQRPPGAWRLEITANEAAIKYHSY